MMKKKFVATLAAAVMTTSCFSMTAFAGEWNTNGGSSTVEGSNWVQQPTLEVVLPADLTFGVNPLRLGVDMGGAAADKNQILSPEGGYQIISYSDVPVEIKCETTAAAAATATDVEFLARAGVVAGAYDTKSYELKNSAANKRTVVLAQEFPTTVAVANDVITFTFAGASWGTAAVAAADIKGEILDGTTTASTTIFRLDAFDGTLKAGNVSGFRFVGAVNPSTTFAEGDLTVKSVFTLTTITAAQKAAKSASKGTTTNNTTASTFADTIFKD